MATDLKTIEFWFPDGTTCTDNTDTNLTQITVYIPESTPVFKSVVLEVVHHERNTTLGNETRRQLSLDLGGTGYHAVDNTFTLTSGGEQWTLFTSADFTSVFTDHWTGTSMTCDAKVLFNSSVASPLNPSWVNISARLIITYTYDTTSTTQIKTVRIPLNCATSGLGNSKATVIDTIPALDTELPESSKVYRQKVIVMQGNDGAGSTDVTLNMQIDTDSAFASYAYEHGSDCNMFVRMNSIETFSTNATHSFYLWASQVGIFSGLHSWLVVTYEFDATDDESDVYVSVMLPLDFSCSPMGYDSTGYQRGVANLWIEEPATITTKSMGAYVFWDQLSTIADLYSRIGTGDFVQYSTTGAVCCGNMNLMVRDDDAFSLARGKNQLTVDIYNIDSTDPGGRLCGFILVNYTCGYPTGGYSSANKTREWFFRTVNESTSWSNDSFTSSISFDIPQASYFISAIGVQTVFTNTGAVYGVVCDTSVERLAAEGGIRLERIYSGLAIGDGEVGIYQTHGDASGLFGRWPSDPELSLANLPRMPIGTDRRWRPTVGMSQAAMSQICIYLTYHTITYTITSTISGSGGGTVYVDLHDDATGELLLSTSRAGNGDVTFNWYDNTDEVFLVAYEDDTHTGRSATDVAGA